MLLSKFTVCDGKKSRFIKEQEAEGLLSMIGKISILAWSINVMTNEIAIILIY